MTERQREAQRLYAIHGNYAEVGRIMGISRGAARTAAEPQDNRANKWKYRSDPEKAEKERERSRRWKREHLGQPGQPKEAGR